MWQSQQKYSHSIFATHSSPYQRILRYLRKEKSRIVLRKSNFTIITLHCLSSVYKFVYLTRFKALSILCSNRSHQLLETTSPWDNTITILSLYVITLKNSHTRRCVVIYPRAKTMCRPQKKFVRICWSWPIRTPGSVLVEIPMCLD